MAQSKLQGLSEEAENVLKRMRKELAGTAASMTDVLLARLDTDRPHAPRRLSHQEEALIAHEFSHFRRLFVFEASAVVKRATVEIEETLKQQKVLEKRAVFCNSEIERKLRVLIAADMQKFSDGIAAQTESLVTRVLVAICPRQSGFLSRFALLAIGKDRKSALRRFVENVLQDIEKALQSVISVHVDKLRGNLGSTLASLSHAKRVNAARTALMALRTSLERSKLDAILLMRSMCRKYKDLRSVDPDEERMKKYLKDAVRLCDLHFRRDAFEATEAASEALKKVLRKKMAPLPAAEPAAIQKLEALQSRVKVCLQAGMEDLQRSQRRLVQSMDRLADKKVHSTRGREDLPKKMVTILSGVDPWTEMASAVRSLLSVLSEAHIVIGEGEITCPNPSV